MRSMSRLPRFMGGGLRRPVVVVAVAPVRGEQLQQSG
jgi:hypothetical protein